MDFLKKSPFCSIIINKRLETYPRETNAPIISVGWMDEFTDIIMDEKTGETFKCPWSFHGGGIVKSVTSSDFTPLTLGRFV